MNTSFLRWIIGVAVSLTVLHLVLLLSWGRGGVVAVLPWDAVVMDSITIVAGVAVAVLAFGRFGVSPEPTPFWEGVAFTAYVLFALFDGLTAPGTLPSGDGLVANMPSTSSWFWHLMFSSLGLFLVCAILLPWPRHRRIGKLWWPWPVVMGAFLIVLVCFFILSFQDFLPLLVVNGAWTPLNRLWSIAILIVFAAGTVLATRQLRRTGDLPSASLAMCLLFLSFAMATDLVGTQLYDVWWYWRRILFAAAFSVMLFGLLLEYVQLYRRERDRTKELVALQQVSRALIHEVELTRVADVIVDQSIYVLQVDAAEVWSADPHRRELTLLSSRGRNVQAGCHLSFETPAFAALVARTEQLQHVDDLVAGYTESLDYSAYLRDGLRSVIGVPLCTRDHLVGVVCYATRKAGGVAAVHMGFITPAAGLFAVEIENSRLFDEVRQALRLREEFMAAAAHELRSPVTIIQGRAEMALKVDQHDERTCRALESILRAVKRINRLVDDLLTALRVRPGILELQCERLDLSTLVNAVVQQTGQTTESYDLQFSREEPIFVYADCDLIRDVLNRLLEGAMRFTPGGGPIQVVVRRRGSDAVVAVTFRGVRIPPERQPFAFEPFYELIPGGSLGYTGLVSLGLYLSKQIVEAHGGSIWLVSAPSDGATFSFSLPITG